AAGTNSSSERTSASERWDIGEMEIVGTGLTCAVKFRFRSQRSTQLLLRAWTSKAEPCVLSARSRHVLAGAHLRCSGERNVTNTLSQDRGQEHEDSCIVDSRSRRPRPRL